MSQMGRQPTRHSNFRFRIAADSRLRLLPAADSSGQSPTTALEPSVPMISSPLDALLLRKRPPAEAGVSIRPGTAVRDRQFQGSPMWAGERRTSERAAASRDAEIADRRHGRRHFGGPAARREQKSECHASEPGIRHR